jgi:hypothetical protein
METGTRTFAFKLAEKKPGNARWKAREGVSVAGCTFVSEGVYWWGDHIFPDGRYEC